MKIDKRINKYKLTKSSGYWLGKKIPGSIVTYDGVNNKGGKNYKFQIRSKANPDTNKKLIKYSNDYLDAIQILEALNNQIDTGDQKTSISTLSELSKDYFKYREDVDVVKNDIKLTTLKKQQIKINPIINEYGFLSLSKINNNTMNEIKSFIVNKKNNDKYPTQRTIEDKIEIFYRLLDYGISENLFSLKDAEFINKSKAEKLKSKSQNKEHYIYSKEEAEFVFKHLEDKEYTYVSFILKLQYYLGLRCSEALGIQYKNFDRVNSILKIRTVITEDGFEELTKTPESNRDLYIPDLLLKLLSQEEINWNYITPESLIFPADKFYPKYKNTCNKSISTNKIGQILRQQFKGTHLEGKVQSHNFRRTFATNAADNGVPIEKLKYIMGHTTIETTLIYYKISPKQIKQAIQSLESFYNS
jgi:integrase